MQLSTKNLAVTTLLILASSTLAAQKFTPNLNFILGANFTRFGNAFENTYNNKSTWKIQAGTGVGLLWTPSLESDVCFGAGLAYTPFGLDYDASEPFRYPFLIEEEAHVHYLQIPLEVGYYKQGAILNYRFTLGVSPSFLTTYSASWMFRDDNANFLAASSRKADQNLSSPIYNRFQIFGLAAFGVHRTISPKIDLGFRLSYQRAFTRAENRDAEYMLLGRGSNFWESIGVMEESRKWTYLEQGSNTMVAYDAKLSNTKLSAIGLMLSVDYAI